MHDEIDCDVDDDDAAADVESDSDVDADDEDAADDDESDAKEVLCECGDRDGRFVDAQGDESQLDNWCLLFLPQRSNRSGCFLLI